MGGAFQAKVACKTAPTSGQHSRAASLLDGAFTVRKRRRGAGGGERSCQGGGGGKRTSQQKAFMKLVRSVQADGEFPPSMLLRVSTKDMTLSALDRAPLQERLGLFSA